MADFATAHVRNAWATRDERPPSNSLAALNLGSLIDALANPAFTPWPQGLPLVCDHFDAGATVPSLFTLSARERKHIVEVLRLTKIMMLIPPKDELSLVVVQKQLLGQGTELFCSPETQPELFTSLYGHYMATVKQGKISKFKLLVASELADKLADESFAAGWSLHDPVSELQSCHKTGQLPANKTPMSARERKLLVELLRLYPELQHPSPAPVMTAATKALQFLCVDDELAQQAAKILLGRAMGMSPEALLDSLATSLADPDFIPWPSKLPFCDHHAQPMPSLFTLTASDRESIRTGQCLAARH